MSTQDKGITVCLAGIPLRLLTKESYPPFDAFRTDEVPVAEVSSDSLTARMRPLLPPDASDRYLGCLLMAECAGRALLPCGRCVFHATAMVWRGRAWLFTAPSGTGKTTQYVLWRFLYGQEVSVLNGDKPLLSRGEDGTILVHPSPWRGKEDFGFEKPMPDGIPLGGIILLAQGAENTIRRMSPHEAVVPLFRQMLISPVDRAAVTYASELEDCILRRTPVWLLVNRGNQASAVLTHDTLLQYAEENEL